VEVPILWVRTGNLWVRFEPIKLLKNTMSTPMQFISVSVRWWQCQFPQHLQNQRTLLLAFDFAADSSRCS